MSSQPSASCYPLCCMTSSDAMSSCIKCAQAVGRVGGGASMWLCWTGVAPRDAGVSERLSTLPLPLMSAMCRRPKSISMHDNGSMTAAKKSRYSTRNEM
jgi:hypothetical protein